MFLKFWRRHRFLKRSFSGKKKHQEATTETTHQKALCGIMSLPEPAQDVHQGDFFRIKDHLNCFSMSSTSRTCLLIGWVGSVSTSIANSRGKNTTTWQTPNTFLTAPEAAISKDTNFQAFGPRTFPWFQGKKGFGKWLLKKQQNVVLKWGWKNRAITQKCLEMIFKKKHDSSFPIEVEKRMDTTK